MKLILLLLFVSVEGLFLSECQLRENAVQWAKEMSRLRREMAAVVAIYDEKERCAYVGCFDDAPFAVAALANKHGKESIAKLRHEEFPAEALENAEGHRLMRSLASSWLSEATELNQGAVPYGNEVKDWDLYDTSVNPFAAGLLAGAETSYDSTADLSAFFDTPEEAAAARLQRRRENLKRKLDEAIQQGDEPTAEKLFQRLTALDDGLSDEEDDDDLLETQTQS